MRIGASTKRSVRAQPGFEPGEIDERLEGRARLALRLGRAVELAVAVIAPADHRPHRAVRRHRDQRALADRVLRRRSAPVSSAIGGLGGRLQARVERRAHGQVAVGRCRRTRGSARRPSRRNSATPAGRCGASAKPRFSAASAWARVMKPGLDHVVEHLRRARAAALSRSRAGLSRLGALISPAMTALSNRVSLRRRFAEIALRRGIDAVSAGAEIDPVQIDFEDLVLGEAVLEPQRQQRLADLAREVALRASGTGSWRAAG